MSKSRKPRVQKKTLLLVGEGYDEEAFLKYLKSELVARSLSDRIWLLVRTRTSQILGGFNSAH